MMAVISLLIREPPLQGCTLTLLPSFLDTSNVILNENSICLFYNPIYDELLLV
jgi:hypothetical protein